MSPTLDDVLAGPAPSTIADVVARMRAIDGCLAGDDGIAAFNRLYLAVTEAIQAEAPTFDAPEFLTRLDVRFARLFFDTLRTQARAPHAWRPLHEARGRAGVIPLQFALAGMGGVEVVIAIEQQPVDPAVARVGRLGAVVGKEDEDGVGIVAGRLQMIDQPADLMVGGFGHRAISLHIARLRVALLARGVVVGAARSYDVRVGRARHGVLRDHLLEVHAGHGSTVGSGPPPTITRRWESRWDVAVGGLAIVDLPRDAAACLESGASGPLRASSCRSISRGFSRANRCGSSARCRNHGAAHGRVLTQLHLAALILYALTGALVAVPLLRLPGAATRGAPPLIAAFTAVGAHFAALLVYARNTGALPLSGLAPALSSLAFLVGLQALLVLWLTRERAIALVAAPLIAVLLVAALSAGFGATAPGASSRGGWFVLHVGASLLGLALIAVAFAASALYLLQHRELKARRFGAVFQVFPPLEQLDRTVAVELCLELVQPGVVPVLLRIVRAVGSVHTETTHPGCEACIRRDHHPGVAVRSEDFRRIERKRRKRRHRAGAPAPVLCADALRAILQDWNAAGAGDRHHGIQVDALPEQMHRDDAVGPFRNGPLELRDIQDALRQVSDQAGQVTRGSMDELVQLTRELADLCSSASTPPG